MTRPLFPRASKSSTSPSRSVIIRIMPVFVIVGVICIATIVAGCQPKPASSSANEPSAAATHIAELPIEWVDGKPVGIVSQWANSKHAQENVFCADCHGDNPLDIKTPTPTTCKGCHAQQVEEFALSTHATAIEHAMTKDSAEYNGKKVEYKWQSYPEGGPDHWGCQNCHSVGKLNENDMAGDCNTCHDGHLYSLVQARDPKTCDGCHAGPGHPQYEAYATSRHGIIWATLNAEFDTSGTTEEFWARQAVEPLAAPTCSTCHMVNGTHNTAYGMAHDLYGERNEDYDVQITYMVEQVCMTCHTEEYAREWLVFADEMAAYTLGRQREAQAMLGALRKDGLIRPTMEVTNSHPIAGQLSAVESKFFQVNMTANRARKGAYHTSSQWAGHQGWTDQSFALMEFRSEVERLRADAERDKLIEDLRRQLENRP